jgi:hypothetical protein
MLYHFYARGFYGTLTYRAGLGKHGTAIAIPTTYKNPMGLAEIFASNYGMNFSMEIDLFRIAHFSSMSCL